MDNRLQLFVERQDEIGSYIELDRFDDESVNLVDSIQDVKDISKIFAPFTRAFHLPSSPTNDEVFGFYYNNQVGTYDARYRTRAIIKISGADYKVGHISMENASMINSGSATSYKIKFTDETITLKDKIGDDKLANLDYNSIRIRNKLGNIMNGVRQGLYRNGSVNAADNADSAYDEDGYELYPDVIYAPIFTKGKVVPVPLRGNTTPPTSNDYEYFLAYFNPEAADGINSLQNGRYRPSAVQLRDYRPAVKASTMLDMINTKYVLGFSREFMFREELDQLYLWHNGKPESDLKGSNAFNNAGSGTSNSQLVYLDALTEASTGTTMDNLYAITSPSTVLPRIEDPVSAVVNSELKLFLNKGDYTGTIDATVSLVVVTASNVELPMWSATIDDIADDGTEYDAGTIFNKNSADSYVDTDGFKYWRDNRTDSTTYLTFKVVISGSTPIIGAVSIAVDTSFRRQRRAEYANGQEYVAPAPINQRSNPLGIATGNYVDLKSQAPDMKILDFVSGIFKMFNLTYQSTSVFDTEVQTIDEFYNNPKILDIGEYVTLDGATISRAMIYKNIKMQYEKSNDAMSGQYSRTNGQPFPDLQKRLDAESGTSYGSEGMAEGKDLSIKVPFSCVMYERLYTSWSDRGYIQPYTPTFDTEVSHTHPNAITDVVAGHSIDSSLKKKDIKNLLFYGKKVDITRNFASYVDENGQNGMLGALDIAPNDVTFIEWGNSAGSQGRLAGLNQTAFSNGTGYKYNHTLVFVNDNGGGTTNAGTGFGSIMEYLEDEDDISIGGGQYKTQWWNPSNIMSSKFRRNGEYMNEDAKIQGLQFNNKNDDEYEYKSYINTGTPSNPEYPVTFNTKDWINGLYDTFYKSYLTGLYDKSSRLYKIQGKLPDHLVSSYKMNDVYRVGNKEFTINKADINLMNGESSLELLTYIPPARRNAVINKNNSLSLASTNSLLDETIVFDLERIRIFSDNFPTKVIIQSGSLNNDYEYVIDGLIPTNFISLGSNNYALRGIETPSLLSGDDDWIRSPDPSLIPHTAYAILEHNDGARSNKSNIVSFFNPVDSTAPTGTMNLADTSTTTVNVNVEAIDNANGSGVGHIVITSSAGFGSSSITQVDQSWNGNFTTFNCTVDAGTLNTFIATISDKSGNDLVLTESVLVDLADTTPPEEPILEGSTSNGGGFHIDLDILNISDNIEVDFVTIMRKTNGGSYALLDTDTPVGNETSIEYTDNSVDSEDNYSYYAFTTDTSGNVSTNSNIYQYIGDSGGDL